MFRDDGRDRREVGGEDGGAASLEPSPSALHATSDLITINVFDEIIVDNSGEQPVKRRCGAAAGCA